MIDWWTVTGTLAGVAGFGLSIWVLVVARGARDAAQAARTLAQRRSLVEELEGAFQKVQQVGNFIQTGAVGSREDSAEPDQFTASFKGKYNVVVDYTQNNDGDIFYWIAITDTEDREILKLYDSEVPNLRNLYRKAQRNAFNVDDAIDEIMGG